MEPIAIVGRASVLPGAHGPDALWQAVRSSTDLVSAVPEGRWRIAPENAMGDGPDRTWCDRGGYVRGFESHFANEVAADPFPIPSDKLLGLDPLFQLVLHTGRAALRDAGHSGSAERVGAIFGNLSYPSASLAKYAEAVWFGSERPDPLNRFMSGMPAHLLATVLGLGGPTFALDAACASSLYAIKLAMDALHDGRADVMLAGAVNRCDDLFIHTGFCALNAMSRSGRSRPFHAEADGLVPAEGAGFLALKRLSDAQRAGDTIHGVIRAVGLSNDGRGKGFLAPAVEGQARAMRAAWEAAGLDPKTVGLLECHATGTQVGDATELKSMAQVFAGAEVAIGSLKSNLGHLITAAGVAGVIKVLEAMRHQERPPTLHAETPNPALADTPFRLLHGLESWDSNGPRRAGINAFGFGGNNAHLILEEPGANGSPARPTRREPVAIVALGARVADGASAQDFMHHLRAGEKRGPASSIDIQLQGLRFPPKDLEQSRAQQTMLLAAAREAVSNAPELSRERTMVLVGMGCDPEVCRYGARWRLADQLDGPALAHARDGIIAALESPGVVGNMPNIPANRLNSQFDLAGPSFTVSAEELSGGVAVELAMRALSAREVDAAVVGAVDLSAEPVHAAALAGVGAPRETGDAAVVFVLQRLSDAERAGSPVLAVLDVESTGRRFGHDGFDAASIFGHAHAANGLVNLAAAALGGEPAEVFTRSLTGYAHRLAVRPGSAGLPAARPSEGPTLAFPAHPPPVPRVHPASTTISEVPMQTMAPAPSLAPTSDDGPARIPTPAPPPTPARAAAPTALAAPGPIQSGPAAALIAIQQHIGRVHRDYLAQQQALHEQFLHTRSAAMHALQSARTNGRAPTASVPRPAMPASPRPAPPTPPAPAPAPPPRAAQVKPASTGRVDPPGLKSRPDDGSTPLPGPRFSREDLEHLASHRISERFGPQFAIQDDFPRQVRMPEPPLLLADRVTGIDAVPGSMTTGTIWTETDVTKDAWYVHHGHMPAGVMIEAGQADLLLISWLGADFQNRGERVYRLLGCELTYRNGLPAVGDTLKYDIHVDGHANQGDTRIFFFHYDCRVGDDIRLSVREGQAGFFTDDELAGSGGILWSPETGEHDPAARLDPPEVECTRSSFDRRQIEAFANGDAFRCFGPGFEVTQAHTRTPRIQEGNMTFLHEVPEVDPRGGPWGRGYLKAIQHLDASDWFFDGHFKDDPCMPGTLMFEGCLQALSFYMTSLGFTVNRDAWRFEPVPDLPYQLKCRGQCIPGNQELIYEVFVEEVHDGPIPTVYADFLCTVDGLKAFHARRVGVQLVPGWPLDEGHAILDEHVEAKPVARMEDGFPFDYRSLLACAWGKPSEAFGKPYEVFDHVKKVARLPGPPYHFLSRVTSVSAPFGGFKPGVKIVVEYDVPPDAWYFWENAYPTMPFAVLLEAALQPCGWLASYVGSALTTDQELFFRNLDGTGNLLVEVLPKSGTLRTEVEITAVSASGGMIIEGFEVTCFLGDTAVYEMKTVFGFFPGVALANQLGIPPNDAERAAVKERTDVVNLRTRPRKYFGGKLRLPEPMLLMCDRITAYWPEGGREGLGRVLGEKDVNPAEWFFASHFFQDPVQPGSLGIENLIQVLMWTAIEKGLDEGMEEPHFEPLMLGRPLTWKYRGQVVPRNEVIRTEIDIVEIGEDDKGRFIVADGWLWADELRIYQAIQMGVRVVDGKPASEVHPRPTRTDRDLGRSYRPDYRNRPRTVIDPATATWLADHCPTFTLPALPAMSMVDRLIDAVGEPAPIGLDDVEIKRWLVLPEAVEVRTLRDGDDLVLAAWRRADREELSRFEPVCSGRAVPAGPAPKPWEPLDAPEVDLPYANGHLFHGEAFHYLVSLKRNILGASGILDAAKGSVPPGATHQGLLDAMTHAIPHDALSEWWPEIREDVVAYPYRLPRFRVYGPAPMGKVRVEVRSTTLGDARFPRSRFQLIANGQVWADGELVEICMPKGPLGSVDPEARRRFLRDGEFVEGVGLSDLSEPGTAIATGSAIRATDWLPGTVSAAYDIRRSDRVREIAIKDAVGQVLRVHPSQVDADRAALRTEPLTRVNLEVEDVKGGVKARAKAPARFDITPVREWWSRWFDIPRWPVEDLYYGLIERFIGNVHVTDPDGFDAIRGRSVLYLANHQVAVESLLFSVLASGLTEVPTVTLAKIEHQHTWLGRLIAHSFRFPDVKDPEVITFFDRDDKSSLPRIIGELSEAMMGPGKSVMVHVEGTRSLECRTPVQKMSSAFVDMAMRTNSPVVPVRFTGALPTEPLEERLEFPMGFGRQDIWFGSPILPEDFQAVEFKARKQMVIDGINGLGPSFDDEVPADPDPLFADAVAAWKGAHPETDDDHAVLAAVLAECPDPTKLTREILAGDADSPWARELQRRLTEGL